MTSESTKRATCWALTIFNKEETKTQLPPGWKLIGQWEQCPTTEKVHLQAMLKTPQERFSAIKRVFPTANISAARNEKALENYVSKEETRVGEFKTVESPNVFHLQQSVCAIWDDDVWAEMAEQEMKKKMPDMGDAALRYVDSLVSRLIEEGTPGAEFAGVNPMWRSSWKRFYRAILVRYKKTDRQTDKESAVESIEENSPAGEWSPMDPPTPRKSDILVYASSQDEDTQASPQSES